MAQYSEDEFLYVGQAEPDYQNQPGVWQTRILTQRTLARILSPILERCRVEGRNFIHTYLLLRDAEILAKCGDRDEHGISNILKLRRKQAIRQKYVHKQFINPDELPGFFYRILKERFYSATDIAALSQQLEVGLDYDVYLDWYELNL